MSEVSVLGVGLWTPGFGSVAAWCAGQADPDVHTPPAELLPRAALRRSTLIARMTASALHEALRPTGLPADAIALLLGSSGGELDHTFANLALMSGDPPSSSPLRFGNSVHNAALGHLSLATHNQRYASALALHPDLLVAGCLIEAIGWVADSGETAALLLADETWPGATFAPVAVALLLGPTGPAPRLRLTTEPGGFVAPSVDAKARANPCGAALDLLHALHQRSEAPVALGRSPLSARLSWT